MDKARLYVDFNELIESDLVLLSKTDIKLDCDGNEVFLFEGKSVDIYSDDEDEQGYGDNLIASGIVEKNNSGSFLVCKWNCRIDNNGIQNESDEIERSLQSDDVDVVTKKLLYITFHSDNWRWVQDKCIELLYNIHEDVRGLAATCLGHVARIHKVIDKDKVLTALKAKEHEEGLRGKIEDAIADIEQFTTQ